MKNMPWAVKILLWIWIIISLIMMGIGYTILIRELNNTVQEVLGIESVF
jgi:hypothetical protein